jgi:DNA-binding response OmpR family regulator
MTDYADRTRATSVLVVDGYQDGTRSLVMLLNLQGFAARGALSGTEALAAVGCERPDVILFEPRTPGAGWALGQQLAEPGVGGRPLLVALTTDTTAVGRHAAVSAGASFYLIKPEQSEVLVDILRACRQAARSEPEPRPALPNRAFETIGARRGYPDADRTRVDGTGLAKFPSELATPGVRLLAVVRHGLGRPANVSHLVSG